MILSLFNLSVVFLLGKVFLEPELMDLFITVQFLTTTALLSQESFIGKEFSSGNTNVPLSRSFFAYILIFCIYIFFPKTSLHLSDLFSLSLISILVRFYGQILIHLKKIWFSLLLEIIPGTILILKAIELPYIFTFEWTLIGFILLITLRQKHNFSLKSLKIFDKFFLKLTITTLLGTSGSLLPLFLAGYFLFSEELSTFILITKFGNTPKLISTPFFSAIYSEINTYKVPKNHNYLFKIIILSLTFTFPIVLYFNLLMGLIFLSSIVYLRFQVFSIYYANMFKQEYIIYSQICCFIITLLIFLLPFGSMMAKFITIIVVNNVLINPLIKRFDKNA